MVNRELDVCPYCGSDGVSVARVRGFTGGNVEYHTLCATCYAQGPRVRTEKFGIHRHNTMARAVELMGSEDATT